MDLEVQPSLYNILLDEVGFPVRGGAQRATEKGRLNLSSKSYNGVAPKEGKGECCPQTGQSTDQCLYGRIEPSQRYI
jgi:hypothetical protein